MKRKGNLSTYYLIREKIKLVLQILIVIFLIIFTIKNTIDTVWIIEQKKKGYDKVQEALDYYRQNKMNIDMEETYESYSE